MARGGGGAVHLVLRVQREHDVHRACQPRVGSARASSGVVQRPTSQNAIMKSISAARNNGRSARRPQAPTCMQRAGPKRMFYLG